MKRSVTLTLAFLGFASLAGCGDDEGSSKLSTGVDGSKPINMLSAAEKEKVCKASQDFGKSFDTSKMQEFGCKLAGLFGAFLTQSDQQAQMVCQQAYTSCQMQPASGGSSNEMCGDFSNTCMATVAEYEACMTDFKGSFGQLVDSVPSCNTLTRAQIGMATMLLTQLPASCQTFNSKCAGGINALPGVPSFGM